MQSFLLTATTIVALLSPSLAQINPDDVPLATREYWCQSQITQCPLICTQETDGSAATQANDCTAENLNYACVCDNNLSPNISEYSQTIPYFICTEANNQCVANCGLNNNACASSCREDNPCGAQNPTRTNATTTTATVSTTSTGGAAQETNADGGVVYKGFQDSTNTPAAGDGGSGAGRLLAGGELYGLGIIAAGVFTGLTILI